jgi:hypothetical protein
MIKNLLNNWKTTSAGITAIVTAAVHLAFAIHSRALTETDCTASIIAIVTGIGLMAAGDSGAQNPPKT